MKSINKRMVLLITGRILGWLLASLGLVWAIVVIQAELNFFSWNPKFNQTIILAIMGYCGTLGSMIFISRFNTRDRISQIVSLIISLILVALAFYIIPAEAITSGLLGRWELSPLWYRITLRLMLLLPMVIWFIGPLRFWKNEKL
jgi:hypothetical protein